VPLTGDTAAPPPSPSQLLASARQNTGPHEIFASMGGGPHLLPRRLPRALPAHNPDLRVDWDPRRLTARIAFGELAGATATATAPDAVERRYALRLVKHRLHQASFRDGVLAAYDHRCAISNPPDDHLPDAAHIMADADELLGQPVIANRIALSKIHHAAFDNHLIGIDPDGRVHVSERLLMV
jgi:putative restriction endonuclease